MNTYMYQYKKKKKKNLGNLIIFGRTVVTLFSMISVLIVFLHSFIQPMAFNNHVKNKNKN